MSAVTDGDIAQASLLYERYHSSVYSYLARVNSDAFLAKDLTQNVFEKMIKYRKSYKEQQNFKAWLFTIARNVNIDHHRRKTYSVPSTDIDIQDVSLNAQQQLEYSENHRKLLTALDLLPEEDRELIVLSKFEKMKYKEIAKMTNISEATLKVKAHRALKKLRTILINDLDYEY